MAAETENGIASVATAFAVAPLCAAASTAFSGLVLGVACLCVLGFLTLLHGARTPPQTQRGAGSGRLPAFFGILGVVACAELILGGVSHELFTSVGIFLPLLTAAAFMHGCESLRPGESGAAPETTSTPGFTLRFTPLGVAALIALTGCVRELAGNGSLLQSAGRQVGSWQVGAWNRAPASGFLIAAVLIALMRTVKKAVA